MSASVDEAHVARLVDAIYDVAVAPGRWADLLEKLAAGFGCHFAGMLTTNADRTDPRGLAFGVDRAEHQIFLRRFHRTNAVALRAPAAVSGQVLLHELIMPRATLERTEMYQAFFRPNRLGHLGRLTVWGGGDAGQQSISLSRPWTAVPFDAGDDRLARTLMPHLQRAAYIARRVWRAEAVAASGLMALEAARQPAFVLGRGGEILHVNTLGEQCLHQADGLALEDGRLAGATRAATRALEGLVRATAATGQGGSLILPRPSRLPGLIAVAMPIGRDNPIGFPDDPAVLLSVADPAMAQDVNAAALMRLFGLTAAEASLAQQLMEGKDLTAIAGESGRSINTVRNQLRRLMHKTDTRRQSELVRLLSLLPRMPSPG